MIAIEDFRGGIPLLAPRRLPAGAAYLAQHCDLTDGSLRASKFIDDGTSGREVVTSFYSAPRAIFPIRKKRFLEWQNPTSVVLSPIAENTNRRVVYVEQGQPPKQTDASLAVDGARPYPSTWYYLGIPQPVQTPSVTVLGGSGSTETRAYVYTLVSVFGEEGPPSNPAVVSGFINGTWRVQGMDAANPGAGYNIITKRIYRVVSGSTTAEYLYVGEVAITASVFDDTLSATALGEPLPSASWLPPPSTLKQIVSTSSGVLVGHDGLSVYASEPNIPHAWPYAFPVGSAIAWVQTFGDKIFVATYGKPVVVSGLTPDQFIITELSTIGSSRQTTPPATSGGAVYTYTNRGLLSIGDGGTQSLSEKYFHPHQQWNRVSDMFFMDRSLIVQDAEQSVTSNTNGKRERWATPLLLDGQSTGDGVIGLPEWAAVTAYCEDEQQLNAGAEAYFAAKGGFIRPVLSPIEGRYFNAQQPYKWWSKYFTTSSPMPLSCLQVKAEFRDLSHLMRYRDAAREENQRTMQIWLGRGRTTDNIDMTDLGGFELGGVELAGDSFLPVHSDPYTNFDPSDGETVDLSFITGIDTGVVTISGDYDGPGDTEIGGIEVAGDALSISTDAGTTTAPKMREPYLRIRVIANPDFMRGESYLEDDSAAKSQTIVFDDYVVGDDRIYRFNGDLKIKADSWAVYVEGLIPVYRIQLATSPEQLGEQ